LPYSKNWNPFSIACTVLIALISILSIGIEYISHLLEPERLSVPLVKLPRSNVDSECGIRTYISIEAETQSAADLANRFVDKLKPTPKDKFTIDLVGKPPPKWFPSISKETISIAQISVEDKSAPFQKLASIAKCKGANAKLAAFILTSGTQDAIALKRISDATKQLSNYQHLKIYVIGLNASNSNAMYEAVKSLRPRIYLSDTKFSDSKADVKEWRSLLKNSRQPIKNPYDVTVTTTKK
jgi:hypothetical protein